MVGGRRGNTDDVSSIREEEAGMTLFARGQKMCFRDFCSVCLCSILVRQRTAQWCLFFFFFFFFARLNLCTDLELTPDRRETVA